MKKNKTMRLASVLLVLTLLTTCMTAGTFAKYTTSAEGTATARVAKFGVEVSADAGTVFGKKYKNSIGGNGVTEEGTSITVKAEKMVVAPGTKGEMTFSIKGTPETSVNLSISLNDESTLKEVMLKGETDRKYKDVTQGKESKETFDLTANYYPVKWTLKNGADVITHNQSKLENTTLSEINKYFKSISKEYNPNTNLTTIMNASGTSGEYTLSWEWAIGDNDKADTLLGDLAYDSSLEAKKGSTDVFEALKEDTDYCLEEAFKLKISVTQVD